MDVSTDNSMDVSTDICTDIHTVICTDIHTDICPDIWDGSMTVKWPNPGSFYSDFDRLLSLSRPVKRVQISMSRPP